MTYDAAARMRRMRAERRAKGVCLDCTSPFEPFVSIGTRRSPYCELCRRERAREWSDLKARRSFPGLFGKR